jgi:hypothetical protein
MLGTMASETKTNIPALIVAGTSTVLIHSGIIWSAAWILREAGVVGWSLEWLDCVGLGALWTLARVWMRPMSDR